MILIYFEGRLGDMYGHKKIFLVGSIWFGVWSLIAGFSVYSGTILFSICRGFQGIGPALMVPNALAIAGRSFEGQKKNIVFSLFGACAPGMYSSKCFTYRQDLTKRSWSSIRRSLRGKFCGISVVAMDVLDAGYHIVRLHCHKFSNPSFR